MKIIAPFQEGEKIPSKFTCEGLDCNPELRFEEVPSKAVSLVLIVEDPDVPHRLRQDGMWDHWIVFNMPPTTTLLRENRPPPGLVGTNTFGFIGYGGPCPPDRSHRYYFKLYALDHELDLQEGATKKEVEQAMQGHILEEAALMGTYEKHHSGET